MMKVTLSEVEGREERGERKNGGRKWCEDRNDETMKVECLSSRKGCPH